MGVKDALDSQVTCTHVIAPRNYSLIVSTVCAYLQKKEGLILARSVKAEDFSPIACVPAIKSISMV